MPSTRRFSPSRVRSQKKEYVSASLPRRLQQPWMQRLTSARNTEALGFAIGRELTGGEVIGLYGDLGTGKTVFVRGLASSLGIPPEQVTSPTFTLIHEYQGRLLLVHVDLYRIESVGEINHIGLQEYYNPNTAVVIEWANRMESELPQDHLAIHFRHAKRSVRIVTFTATGPQSDKLLSKIMSLYST